MKGSFLSTVSADDADLNPGISFDPTEMMFTHAHAASVVSTTSLSCDGRLSIQTALIHERQSA